MSNLTPQSTLPPPFRDQSLVKRIISRVVKGILLLAILLATLWALLVLWVHLNDFVVLRWLVVIAVAITAIVLMIKSYQGTGPWRRWLAGYAAAWMVLAAWFMWLPAKQDRGWKAEVSQQLSFSVDESNSNLIRLHNVRDFDWARKADSEQLVQPDEPYFYRAVEKGGQDEVITERWIDRTIDLTKLNGIDIINSYWMGEQIGHTLLSFRFEDDRPLSFSIEIRKEEDESFSAFGGFVKQFEMAIVASEERDILYTRSNVRGEQVYIFPIQGLRQEQVRDLFIKYLEQAQQLQQNAKWYNTLIRNCTTVIFDMARAVSNEMFPWDYRILLSGYVPNYLYDEGLLPKSAANTASDPGELWSIEDWYIHAHINPKVSALSYEDNQHPTLYSQKIREGLPQPELLQR